MYYTKLEEFLRVLRSSDNVTNYEYDEFDGEKYITLETDDAICEFIFSFEDENLLRVSLRSKVYSE